MEKRTIKAVVIFIIFLASGYLLSPVATVTEAKKLINKPKPKVLWESMLQLSFKILRYPEPP